MRKRVERTAEQVIMECEAKIKMGVDIAKEESLKVSIELFKKEMPELYEAFYKYVQTGEDTLSSIVVSIEDMERVSNPLIPTKLSFMYNLLEHLFAYNCTYDKETRKRVKDLYDFVYGFREVGFGVFVKLQGNYVYIANTLKGETYKRKIKGLKYIDINKDYYYITGVKENGKVLVLTDAYMDISRNYHDIEKLGKKGIGDKWYKTGTKLDKGYIRIQHGSVYIREHLLMVSLIYGIEVAKHLVRRNGFLTIDHINGIEDDNRISNLRVVTRETNGELKRDIQYEAYNFLEMYCRLKEEYNDFYII